MIPDCRSVWRYGEALDTARYALASAARRASNNDAFACCRTCPLPPALGYLPVRVVAFDVARKEAPFRRSGKKRPAHVGLYSVVAVQASSVVKPNE